MSRARSAALAALALLLTTPARAVSPRTPLGADSPQALVERMVKAADKKDVAEIFACLDPQSRAEGTTALLMGTTMMLAFMDMGSGMATGMAEGMAEALSDEPMKPEDKAKLEKGKAEMAAKSAKLKAAFSAVLKKHGLPDLLDPEVGAPKEGPEALLAKVDQPALAADLLGIMEQLGDKKDAGANSGPPVPRHAGDYKITGDTATARSGDDTLEFVRIDGRWFFKPPKKEADKGENEKK
jgi:hypothetical protein